LQISFKPRLHEWTPKKVFSFKDHLNVTSAPYMSELLRDTLRTWHIYRAQKSLLFIHMIAALEINNWINESFGLATELKINHISCYQCN
jgi:hypothetical protein